MHCQQKNDVAGRACFGKPRRACLMVQFGIRKPYMLVQSSAFRETTMFLPCIGRILWLHHYLVSPLKRCCCKCLSKPEAGGDGGYLSASACCCSLPPHLRTFSYHDHTIEAKITLWIYCALTYSCCGRITDLCVVSSVLIHSFSNLITIPTQQIVTPRLQTECVASMLQTQFHQNQ